MKRVLKSLPILVCLFLHQTNLKASSHREAPLIAYDPQADNTDVYAFRSPSDSSKVVLIADYIPFQHPAGGPNWYHFGPNIRYEIHVKNKTTTTIDDITYRFTFKDTLQDPTTFFNIRLGAENLKTTYTLEKITNGGSPVVIVSNGKVPPNNIGPRSIESPVGLNAANYDALITSSIMTASGTGAGGEKVFAGPADDPFFVDLGGAFDLGGFRAPGRDGLNRMNVHSICVEVPISTLHRDGKTTAQAVNILDSSFVIGVWASASRPQMTTLNDGSMEPATSGNWVQVSRLGMPLTNEAVNPIGDKDRWNATSPYSGAAELSFAKNFNNPELALYMDDSQFGGAVPGLAALRIQTKSLKTATDSGFDFRNGKKGLYRLKGNPALVGTALDPATYGNILLPDSMSPRAVDILPIFYTGVPNLRPYQLATGKPVGSPLSAGKPFINNFLPTLGDMLRLNMAVPVTPRNSPDFNSLGLVYAAVLGLTDGRFNTSAALQNIPNMDGFPNGRRLEDDVTTIELQAVGGVVLAAIGLWYDDYNVSMAGASPVTPQLGGVLGFNAGVTKNDTTLKATFPYVQGPWRGFVGPQYAGPAPCGAPTDRLYVDASLPTSGSGSSWACGLKELREAVKIANTNPAIKSIWVADGTYYATTTRGAQDYMELTRADLRIIGGFSGNETMASQANPTLNPTIISGDIGTVNVNTDNSPLMLVIHDVPANASRLVIDGFIFERAFANLPGRDYGSAIISYSNTAANPVQIRRTIFRNNTATNGAGAIYMDRSPLEFDSCRFTGNTSPTGGAIFSFQSSPVFRSCVFAGNSAPNGNGGAYYGNYGLVRFIGCAFNGNTATVGGVIYQNALDVEYYNAVISNNTATQFAGGIYQFNGSNTLILQSTFFANAGASGGAITLGANGCRTTIWNSLFYRNTANGGDVAPNADILNTEGTNNVIRNTALQLNTQVPADNGSNYTNNIRTGANPQFTNMASPIGVDGVWFTADDGLQIAKLSPYVNAGSNSLTGGLPTDVKNDPRVACTTVDLGAYEQQVCADPFRTAPVVPAIAGAVANPFNNDLQIRYSGEEKANIQVTSVSGKIMAVSATAAKGITHVNATTWTSGIYNVEIVTNSGKKVNFKVIKL